MIQIEGLRETILGSRKKGEDILSVIIGQEEAKEKILASILSGHHILIEGPPGIGKTTLTKSIAFSLPSVKAVKECPYHCDPAAPICPTCKMKAEGGEKLEADEVGGQKRFVRIQGSPDLTAEDLLGDIDPSMAFKYGPQDYRSFTPGKLLRGNRGVVFFDEINRVPEKLQNALLEVLEEGIATIGPYDVDYPANFVMIATMNPREHAGVEELSDVLLDRFDVVKMTYPETPEREKEIIKRFGLKFEGVEVPDDLVETIVKLVRATREDPWLKELDQPASVRAGLSLYEKVQALALLRDSNIANPEDIERVATSALAFLVDSYNEELDKNEVRVVLRLHPSIAPIKAAVLPLSRREGLVKLAKEIHQRIRPYFMTLYDDSQSIGRRYRRQDEIGTPFCVTIDFQSIEDNQVTVRERDTMLQIRIPIAELTHVLQAKLTGESFENGALWSSQQIVST